MIKTSLILIILIAFSSNSLGLDLEPANSILWSGALDCEVADGIAYCAFLDGFMVVDMSNPNSPLQMSKIWLDDIGSRAELKIQGNYVYLAAGSNTLYIIDISDPFAPFLVHSMECPGITGICISNGHAFITAWNSEFTGLKIFDLSNPIVPELISSIVIRWALSVFVKGDYAFVAGEIEGFYIIDIGDLNNPEIVFDYYVWGPAVRIMAYDNYLYILDLSSGIYIYNIYDPADPVYSCMVLLEGGRDFIKHGDYIYCAREWGGFSIIDVSNPVDPAIVDSINISGISNAVCCENIYLYVTSQDNGVYTYNIANPDSPAFAGGYFTPWYGLADIKVSGNYAYTCGTDYGFISIDIADPYDPIVAGHCDTPNNQILNLDIDGDYAYLAQLSYGLHVIDISNPGSPTLISSLPLPNGARGIVVDNGYAFLTSHDVLNIVNIQNPPEPHLDTSYDALRNSFGIDKSGDFLYITEDYDLKVIDVSDPLHPFSTGACDLYARRVFVKDGLAYVSCMTHGLSVVDVSDPYEPHEISNYQSEGWIYSAVVDDRFAYLSEFNLSVLNIENPEQPEFEASCNIANRSADIQGDFIYLTTEHSIHILHANYSDIPENKTLPLDFSLIQNYPNPFNTSTLIKYNLPTQAQVSLDIYDILGRKIATLEDGLLQAGYHQIEWNAEDVSSGLYFYKLQAGDYTESNKMLLIK